MTTYDDIPYPSYAYWQASPSAMAGIAGLFGLTASDVSKANILEIGCASGGNILPLATQYKDASFLGVDLSVRQIEEASQRAAELSLGNIEFLAGSLLDVDLAGQQFDFIIVHGVFSWVPTEVQDGILRLCRDNLTANGLAYISYNTLPGWNAVQTVRDMMLYHGQRFDDPAMKIKEARRMLSFVTENLSGASGAYKMLLEQEVKTLQQADDNYLFHDHLEASHDPCYFHQFMERAEQYGLSYLADAELPTMYLGNHSAKVSETLRQLDNIIEQEQYLDFITNRRFRMTILTRQGREPVRNIRPTVLKNLSFHPLFSFSEETKGKLVLVSQQNSSVNATITGEVAIALYKTLLAARPDRISYRDFLSKTANLLEQPKSKVSEEFGNMIIRLIFSGLVAVASDVVPKIAKVASKKPTAFVYARLQAQTLKMVTNLRQEQIRLSDDQRVLLQYLNSENDVTDIAHHIKGLLAAGTFSLKMNDKPLSSDQENLDNILAVYIQQQVKIFQQNGLLVA